MKDEQLLKDYFSSRLADCQSSSVPEFEAMFAADALVVPKGHQLKFWPKALAGVSATAAAAAAAVYLFVVSPDKETPPDVAEVAETIEVEAPVEEEIIATEQEPVVDEPYVRPVTRSRGATLTNAFASEDMMAVVPAPEEEISEEETPVVDETPEETPRDGQPSVQPADEPTPQYERSIEQAHREAQASRPRRHSRTRVGVSLARDNSLLASATGRDYHSPMSSVLSAYPAQGASLRAASSRNEWRQPDNLLSSQIASYAPVYHLPLSAGITVEIPLEGRWSLVTGLNYTFLSADITGSKEDGSDFLLKQYLHYAGIPVDLTYRLLDGDWGLYVSAGGGLEKGITGVQTCQVTARNGSVSRERVDQGIAGVQPYTDLSLGLSYRLDRKLLLYIEPGMAYYFDTRQPMSARTKHPLNMSLSAGFRFSL